MLLLRQVMQRRYRSEVRILSVTTVAQQVRAIALAQVRILLTLSGDSSAVEHNTEDVVKQKLITSKNDETIKARIAGGDKYQRIIITNQVTPANSSSCTGSFHFCSPHLFNRAEQIATAELKL